MVFDLGYLVCQGRGYELGIWIVCDVCCLLVDVCFASMLYVVLGVSPIRCFMDGVDDSVARLGIGICGQRRQGLVAESKCYICVRG